MTVNETLQKAKDGGFPTKSTVFRYNYLLEPLFWQCLGKSLGWPEVDMRNPIDPAWLWRWHMLIDHLAEGKDIDDYFKGLEKNP